MLKISQFGTKSGPARVSKSIIPLQWSTNHELGVLEIPGKYNFQTLFFKKNLVDIYMQMYPTIILSMGRGKGQPNILTHVDTLTCFWENLRIKLPLSSLPNRGEP